MRSSTDLDEVEVAHAHAAAGDDGVAARRRPARSAADGGLVVAHEPEVDRLEARLGDERQQHRAGCDSRIWPGCQRSAPSSTSSSPVDSTPTRGAAHTATSVRPMLASTTEVSRADDGARGDSDRVAAAHVVAGRPHGVAGGRGRCRCARRRSTASVSSTITMASAPGGTGAPVMIRIASPGPTGVVGAAPAASVPTTRSSHRRVGAASADLHGVAVDRGVGERRDVLGRRDRPRP